MKSVAHPRAGFGGTLRHETRLAAKSPHEMEVYSLEHHRTKWWIFQQAMFDYQRVYIPQQIICLLPGTSWHMFLGKETHDTFSIRIDVERDRVINRLTLSELPQQGHSMPRLCLRETQAKHAAVRGWT